MLLLGHRGCRGAFVENTFAAFDHALECGCDGFEFDVRLTRDLVPVIWHDARLRGGFLSRQPWGSLKERCLKAGLRRRSIELCELEEVLARYRQVAWMDIELKVPGLESPVVDLVRRYRPERGFLVSSFRRRILEEVHRLDPEIPLGFIFERMPRSKLLQKLPLQYVKPNAKLVTAKRVKQFHESGVKVLTWTVNSAPAMHRLAEAGVDGVIGDDPATLALGR
jgi:glycerophosphoryl diester phosphodiesterase